MEKTKWQKNLDMVVINILKKLERSVKADTLKDQILNIKTAFSDLNTALQELLDSLEEDK